MNELVVFDFKDNVVRTVKQENGDVLFNAKDVCAILDIKNVSKACEKLDDDEKGITTSDTLGGKQEVLMITESGLYSLIFTSRKPEAKAFRKWVTSEVLPAIRQTGSYAVKEKTISEKHLEAKTKLLELKAQDLIRARKRRLYKYMGLDEFGN